MFCWIWWFIFDEKLQLYKIKYHHLCMLSKCFSNTYVIASKIREYRVCEITNSFRILRMLYNTKLYLMNMRRILIIQKNRYYWGFISVSCVYYWEINTEKANITNFDTFFDHKSINHLISCLICHTRFQYQLAHVWCVHK